MVFTIPLIFLAILTCAFVHVLSRNLSANRRPRLPPGPNPYPIIGNILELGEKPHESLAKLSKTYGPLMCLKLGSRTAIIVSSPAIAKDVLQKYDQQMSSRTVPDSLHVLDHHKASVVWLPANSKWRHFRKICKEHIFSAQRLEGSRGLRLKKFGELRAFLEECCAKGVALDIGAAAFTTSLNLVSNTIFSIDFAHYSSDLSYEIKEIVWASMEVLGTPNFADFFPIIKFADPQGIRRKSRHCMEKLFGIFDGIIRQRLHKKPITSLTSLSSSDMLEALLELHQKDSEFSISDIKHLIWDLLVAGTDTTAGTVEWAMAELICHPEVLAKARDELNEVLEENNLVQESDIPRLPYLQAVVKEIFRLHPIGPLLVPHKADVDVDINGYLVPRNAQILINVWAMGRDSNIWENADSFKPERFLHSETDYTGKDFKLIPLGAGRRMCPGLPLAHRMLHVSLACMIHNFDWELENGMKPTDVRMNSKFGLTLQRIQPLRATPKRA